MPKTTWDDPAQNASPDGEFVRDTTYIEDRFSAELVAKNAPQAMKNGAFSWPVEPGRYRLMAARACPWAHRTVITRRLLGLEDVISLGLAGPTHDRRSWVFDLDPNEEDPATGLHFLQDAYFNRFPNYPRGITVPAIVETASKKVVTNNFPTIPVDFIDEWAQYHREGAPDLYPAHLRAEIDKVTTEIYHEVNNGVYRCGFAGSQEAYDTAYDRLWKAMDWLEDRLSTRRFLMGEHITLADIYLFPTLVRFDPVYYSHFKCSRQRLTEMPNLWGYLKELFQVPGFGDTTDFTEIKQHYFITHQEINPTAIVPAGPDMSAIMEPHGRDHLPGSPFPEGTVLPGPVPTGEEVKHPESFQH
ncbi:glutathione S-transferase C-terminal domain-containing protein [Corynebacterium breve]|uniref:Glutathione S-transferase C-terminal domain-containing protein n=1 Tax=Corynebacterium breve TaxID=3049799 RepID=A0ABY8VKB7_9CORY|nr:glutathione S-transferase C-terminal domain-containing protein [Corynebacterium breve]WIM68673.1 glutathione S-transferase C-terminal domain-containing protein [Corynebacterium breve]